MQREEPTKEGALAQLILGPLLRDLGERDATVWVETDEACRVQVLGAARVAVGAQPGFGFGALAALRSAASPRSSADRASDF